MRIAAEIKSMGRTLHRAVACVCRTLHRTVACNVWRFASLLCVFAHQGRYFGTDWLISECLPRCFR